MYHNLTCYYEHINIKNEGFILNKDNAQYIDVYKNLILSRNY